MNDKKPVKSSEAQVKANITQNKRRIGTPTFSAIRFDKLDDEKKLAEINETISLFGTNKKDAVIAAFKLLRERLDSEKDKK